MAATFDQALVLRLFDWSETSQVAVLLTKSHGLVRAVAKGSRRPAAKFSGGFELLSGGTAGLIIKPERELATCTEWDLSEPFWHLRTSLQAFWRSSMIAELAQRLVIDRQSHEGTFAAVWSYLRSLRGSADDDAELAGVMATLLTEAGVFPQVLAMLDGQEMPGGDVRVAFSPDAGGVVGVFGSAGTAAASSLAGTVDAGNVIWPVNGSTLRWLAEQSLQREGQADSTEDAPAHGPEARRAARFLIVYAEYVLAQPLATRRFCFPELERMGQPQRGGMGNGLRI